MGDGLYYTYINGQEISAAWYTGEVATFSSGSRLLETTYKLPK